MVKIGGLHPVIHRRFDVAVDKFLNRPGANQRRRRDEDYHQPCDQQTT